jgi:hypothetical protein
MKNKWVYGWSWFIEKQKQPIYNKRLEKILLNKSFTKTKIEFERFINEQVINYLIK